MSNRRFTLHPELLDLDHENQWAESVLRDMLQPDFEFSDDDDGYYATSLIMAAVETGIIGCPDGADLWLDLSLSMDRTTQYYAFYITLDWGPQMLRLYGEVEDYSDFVDEGRGRDAVLAMCDEAVTTANALLAALDSYVQSLNV